MSPTLSRGANIGITYGYSALDEKEDVFMILVVKGGMKDRNV